MEKIYRLDELKTGEKGLIERIDISDLARKKRLFELGFVRGLDIEVLKENKKLMIVGVLSSCFSIDKELASKIYVYKRARV